jgi:hypothetical protein
MPKIDKLFTMEIGVERFLDACSSLELREVELLITSPRYQNKINPPKGKVPRMKNPPMPPDTPSLA